MKEVQWVGRLLLKAQENLEKEMLNSGLEMLSFPVQVSGKEKQQSVTRIISEICSTL